MKLVVLAGGRGTRMGSLTADVPKPMVRLAGKPILEHQIELAKRYGLREIYILTGHLGHAIEEYFGDGSRWDLTIRCMREHEPLGTAGAVRQLAEVLTDDFLVFYGDVMMDVDLAALVRFHRRHDPVASIAVHPNDHPYDSDIVETTSDNRVTAIHNKPHSSFALHRNLVSGALYCLSPRILQQIEQGVFADFGRNIFPRCLARGADIRAYNTREYIKDIGTVQRLVEVEQDIYSGRVARFNRGHALGVVFLDRDGVLNPDDEPVRKPDQLMLYPGVAEAVKMLNKSERLSVVVTNQPLVAKGIISEADLNDIHSKLETLLSANGAYIDRIYYCPHHPEWGHADERPEYKVDCNCRKPRTGLIARAVTDLNIDLSDSFIVGDRTVDVMTGRNAGIATILVRTGSAGTDGITPCDPDFTCDDLTDAVQFITGRFPALMRIGEQLLGLPSHPDPIWPMIVIGGQSRAGKSTFAAVLRMVLARRGIISKHLRLDHWIVSSSLRQRGDTVRDRYRYQDIVDTVRRLMSGATIAFERYDAAKRDTAGCRETLAVEKGELLIVDGTVALDLPPLRDVANLRVYVEVPETVREARFFAFYRAKGLDDSAIQSLYDERRISEYPIILRTRQYADHVINLERLS